MLFNRLLTVLLRTDWKYTDDAGDSNGTIIGIIVMIIFFISMYCDDKKQRQNKK
jgi:hypothetical protein